METTDTSSPIIARLEALLFIYGDPIGLKKAATLLGVTQEELVATTLELKQSLAGGQRGLMLVEHDGNIQLVTKPEFSTLSASVLRAEMNEALSPAALETLSVITYAGPVGRAEIDYIRGVNSSFTLRALLLRGLIERDTDPERANAYRYRPSVELVHHLGITQVSELPEFERFRALVATLKQPQAAPATPEVVNSGIDSAQQTS